MKTIFSLCCTALILCCSCGKRITQMEAINIVPNPASVQAGTGVFDLTDQTPIVLLSDDSTLNYSVKFFNDALSQSFGKALPTVTGSTPQLHAINIQLGDMEPEAYSLEIQPDRIQITGGTPAGVFYAFQTLRQLLPIAVAQGEQARVIELPAAVITDKPHFAYRGAMLDVCRHFFGVEDVKSYIDILALHKINRFHWHLTDDQGWRIEIKKYPELTRVGAFRDRCNLEPVAAGEAEKDPQPYGGFYTQDQIKEIIHYAAERFITIVPEIEMPGHASAALASYPYLGCKGEGYTVPSTWGVKEEAYCAGKDSTFLFLEDVLTEVIALFPSEYIHIGGDECMKGRWQACPLCQKRIKSEKLKNEAELQSYFVQRIEQFINSKGRKMIGWDEILEGGLSKTASIMSWRGAAGGIEAAKSGNHVVMTPNSHCYLDYYQTDKTDTEPKAIGGFLPIEKVYSLDPYAGLNADETRCILGVQGNLWTEFISTMVHAQYMALPRLAALAEIGWSYGNTDFDAFKMRMNTLSKFYDAYGYNYAKHMFSVADTTANVQ